MAAETPPPPQPAVLSALEGTPQHLRHTPPLARAGDLRPLWRLLTAAVNMSNMIVGGGLVAQPYALAQSGTLLGTPCTLASLLFASGNADRCCAQVS